MWAQPQDPLAAARKGDRSIETSAQGIPSSDLANTRMHECTSVGLLTYKYGFQAQH